MNHVYAFDALDSASKARVSKALTKETYALCAFDAGDALVERTYRDEANALDAFAIRTQSAQCGTLALYKRDADGIALELLHVPLAPANVKRIRSKDAQRVAIAASDSSASHVANASDTNAQTRKKGTRKMTKKNSGISHAQIIAAVASNPNRVNQTPITSVVHAERVASIDEHKLIAADGTKLYAYVNASGILTCETQAEMKERKSARAARKQANKVGMLSTESARVANAASAPDIHAASNARIAEVAQADAIAQALELLRSAGIDVQTIASAPAQTASANARKSAPKVAQTASAPATRGRAQNEREIATICNYLDKLNMTRTKFERENKKAFASLDTLSVAELRAIKNTLRVQDERKQS
jgi:hypothetical protein